MPSPLPRFLRLCTAWAGVTAAAAGLRADDPSGAEGAYRDAIARGIDFLIARQEPNGAWGSARNTKSLNIYAPVPGAHLAFRTATTALCINALHDCGDMRPEVSAALARAEEWLCENLPNLRRATADTLYNVWGHAYGMQALARMLRRDGADAARAARLREAIAGQIDWLGRYECAGGGWAYYDFNAHTQRPSGTSPSFVTATVLVAFHEAREAGIEIPSELVARGMASIVRQRKPDFSYLYADGHRWRPMRTINRPAGSLGRSQACNIALRRWGDTAITDDVLRAWIERLFVRNGWLDIGRKRPIPHEAWFQIAGYFFYYGHYYAVLCMEELDPAVRVPYAEHMAELLLGLQEKDGSWWDYPLYDYHQQYGTAYALLALARCARMRGD